MTRETGLDKDRPAQSAQRGCLRFRRHGHARFADHAERRAAGALEADPARERTLRSAGTDRNNWLALTVAGDQDNRMAIGARVDIFSGARKQSWEVSGASGYLGQGPPGDSGWSRNGKCGGRVAHPLAKRAVAGRASGAGGPTEDDPGVRAPSTGGTGGTGQEMRAATGTPAVAC